jgi:hypothetical protein
LCYEVSGGADGVRTHDLLDAIEARSQLRHGPTDESPLVYITPGRNGTSRLQPHPFVLCYGS